MGYTFESLLLIVIYGSLAVVVYAYLGYPLLLSLWASLKGKPVLKGQDEIVPSVTVVIAAWNEEARILARVRNVLDQDYPPSNLDVLVVSDGSTDGTVSAVLSMGSDRVAVLALDERKGKAVAINHGVASARGEIIVFADARQRFSRLRKDRGERQDRRHYRARQALRADRRDWPRTADQTGARFDSILWRKRRASRRLRHDQRRRL